MFRLKQLSQSRRDFLISCIAVFVIYVLTLTLNLSEHFVAWAAQHESIQIDELPLILLTAALAATWFSHRRMQELKAEILLRQQAEEKVGLLFEENQALAHHAIQAQEDERKRLAREIHDDLGQYLTAIRLDAAAIPKHGVAAIKVHGERIARHTEHIQLAFRNIVHRIRPAALDDYGLTEAIRLLAEEWCSQNPQVDCHLILDDTNHDTPEKVSLVAYRMVQETLTNVARHAKASMVEIRISLGDSNHLVVKVRDDGIGFSTKESRQGMGLIGMRERIEKIGGTFELISKLGGGVAISATMPL
jgi:two-component system, NarL family, sensor histidine kinase UhpB